MQKPLEEIDLRPPGGPSNPMEGRSRLCGLDPIGIGTPRCEGLRSYVVRLAAAEGIGASIELAIDLRPELALFHEGPSRVLVSTATPEAVERIALKHGIDAVRIGVTMKEWLRIGNKSMKWIDCSVDQLQQVRESALEDRLAPQHV